MARTNDLNEGLEQRAMRITNTPGESIGAYVTWNAKRRRFGLASCDNTEGQHEVYFQAFEATGTPAAPPERLTRNATDSLVPAIKPAGDGFALVWNEYAPTRRDVHEAADSPTAVSLSIFSHIDASFECGDSTVGREPEAAFAGTRYTSCARVSDPHQESCRVFRARFLSGVDCERTQASHGACSR